MSICRRATSFGHGRRKGRAVARTSASGPNYLLDYNDASFSRASEAAFVDPREGWAFEATGWRLHETPSTDIVSDWTVVGTPIVTGSQADPLGGTDATTIEDDNASGFESTQWDGTSAMAIGGAYRFTIYIAKDADETRFPEFQFRDTANAQSYYVDVNTSTGATAVRTTSGWVSASHTLTSYDDDWWLLSVEVASSTTNAARISVLPAVGTSLGSASVSAVGSTTVYVDQIDAEAAWKATDVPRILSDGAILIEGSRTNVVLDSEALSSGSWSNATAGVTTTADAGDAPDGTTDADQVDTTSGARRFRRQTLTLADNTDYDVSAYAQRVGGSDQPVSLVYQAKNVAAQYVDDTATAEWARLSASFNSGTGAGTPQIGVGNDGTSATSVLAWAAQMEAGRYASSPIRTVGATGTRAVERASYTAGNWPEAIASGCVKWTFVPNYGSADVVAVSSSAHSIWRSTSNSGCNIRETAGQCRIAVLFTSGAPRVDRSVSFSAGDVLSITIDWPNLQVTLEGFTTGDGTFALSGGSGLSAASDPLYIGYFGTSASQYFDGVICRPEAA